MSFGENLRRAGRISALVGAVGFAGCEGSPDEAFSYIVVQQGFNAGARREAESGNFRRAEAYNTLGELSGTAGQWKHDENIADRGKTEVNFNGRNSLNGDNVLYRDWRGSSTTGGYNINELTSQQQKEYHSYLFEDGPRPTWLP